MIRITSKIEGFRRAGLTHSARPTDYDDGVLSPTQLAALEAEPNLMVQQVVAGTGDVDGDVGEGHYDRGYADGLADGQRQADDATRRALTEATRTADQRATSLADMTAQRDEAYVAREALTKDRDDARAALAAITTERDALLSAASAPKGSQARGKGQ